MKNADRGSLLRREKKTKKRKKKQKKGGVANIWGVVFEAL